MSEKDSGASETRAKEHPGKYFLSTLKISIFNFGTCKVLLYLLLTVQYKPTLTLPDLDQPSALALPGASPGPPSSALIL